METRLARELAWERFRGPAFGVGLAALALGLVTMVANRGASGFPRGHPVDGEVEQVAVVTGGRSVRDLIDVRLADGSMHRVSVRQEYVGLCRIHDRIALVQNGQRLSAGLRGCMPREEVTPP